jgi:hypothetical protein
MAKIKCEYCGEYILDTDERCSNCGAVNDQHTRVVKETPTTIEELKSWYRARNLPPEETTRFFIGKDIREARAFGIYEDDSGNFVVYKNKADGQRAVRYKGNDEAYAVNELYLRLKEEILNQKSKNIQKQQGRSYYSSSRNRTTGKKRGCLSSSIISLLILFVTCIPILGLFSYLIDYNDASSGYYINNETLYYYEGWSYGHDYRWWVYDADDSKWSIYQELEKDGFILDFNGTDNILASNVEEAIGIKYDDFNIYRSKEYIDAGHHYEPDIGYYKHGDDIYYYLDDRHSDYGEADNSGWYKHNASTNDWEFYCYYENRELIDDELWYYEDDYYIGYNDSDWAINGYDWNTQSFTSTTWYESYLENEAAYDAYLADKENDSSWDDDDDWDWGSDSDYDWDDDYDWDSGDTDWDSDW